MQNHKEMKRQHQEPANDEVFSEAICKKLGNYVYRLIDPRNGETFYVGKGKGNRVFAHVAAALTHEKHEDELSTKISRIHDIKRSGLKVVHVIHRHGIPDNAIFEVEAALIDAFPGLSNIAGGHGSNDRGPMNAVQIIDKFELPEIDSSPQHKLVLINVNKFSLSSTDDLYNQVRFSWRINKARAEKSDYVLAVVRGVAIGAFVADAWHPATKEFFPEFTSYEPTGKVTLRHGFIGKKAPAEIWELYCGKRGKRIPDGQLQHVQNPIRYWKV